MTVNSYQHQLLIQMGIPVWQKRSSAASVVENQPAINLENERLQHRHWLLLPTKTLTNSEKKLLTAMLKSIKLSLHDVALFSGEEVDAMQKNATASHKILILDEFAVVSNETTNTRWVSAPSLQQLIAQPAMKPLAWQALQRYIQLD